MKDVAWDDLKLFLNVAAGGGLSAAAERTGISAPTIGRRMLALERETGRKLFIRSQQGYRLAPDGEVLLQHVRAMQQSAQTISDWHQKAFALPLVSVGSDAWLSRFVADHLGELRGPADPFRMCCKALHQRVDFTYREADVGIVGRRPENGNLAARRSVDIAYAVYRPAGRMDKDELPWISIGTESAYSAADKWAFERHEADVMTWTNAAHLVPQLIANGAGKGLLPCFIGDAAEGLLRDGPVLDELTTTMWIVANDDDRHRAEMRLVIERLHALLKRHRARFAGCTD